MTEPRKPRRPGAWPGGARIVPKVGGGDIELGNSMLGLDLAEGTGALAARLLLARVKGIRRNGGRSPSGHDGPDEGLRDVQDVGRLFLPSNGGSIYIDLGHLELAMPEVLCARSYVAVWHAMLRIAGDALQAANVGLPEGRRIVALVNNSDGLGHSYGSHLNVLIRRDTWDDLFRRRLQRALLLAAFQASSIVFTGAGKIGAENGRPDANYQIAQRADFFEELVGSQTTYRRPMVNSRDEAHCGRPGGWAGQGTPARRYARLHCIFYDNTLCHVSTYLKFGTLQLMLALLETGWFDAKLLLDDPLEALGDWSRNPSCTATARLVSGRRVTAVEMQQRFCEAAARLVSQVDCDAAVPGAERIVSLWRDTLDKLARRDWPALAPRLDWVLKWSLLDRARRQRGLNWDAPELKRLDLLYSDLGHGLYWSCEQAGGVERLVGDGEVERYVHTAPEETRAWTRAALLQRAEPDEVDFLDWDTLRFRIPSVDGWTERREVALSDPLGFSRCRTGALLDRTTTLEEALAALATEAAPAPVSAAAAKTGVSS